MKKSVEISVEDAIAIRDFLWTIEDIAPKDFSRALLAHSKRLKAQLEEKIEAAKGE